MCQMCTVVCKSGYAHFSDYEVEDTFQIIANKVEDAETMSFPASEGY